MITLYQNDIDLGLSTYIAKTNARVQPYLQWESKCD